MRKLTTEQFIEKAIAKHGLGEFDYSKTVYVRGADKLTIICKRGHTFEQTGASHLYGRGCPFCSGLAGHSTETFIARAKALRAGEGFDYSEAEYINNYTPLAIGCQCGHKFLQAPSNHFAGQGCPRCSGVEKYTSETWRARALILRAGEGFDYSEAVYKGHYAKLWITCQVGHRFAQSAGSHLGGASCASCAGNAADTTETFIAKARNVHGIEFDYSLSDYVDNGTKITIKCSAKHLFTQTPNAHLGGSGCPHCAGMAPLTTEIFIARSVAAHDGRYGYTNAVYKGNHRKVTVTCPEHGNFDQIADAHMRGVGCPACAVTGYAPGKEGTLYYLRVTDTAGVIRYKIGITNRTVQKRFKKNDLEMIDILGEYYHGNGANPLAKETFVLGHFKHAKYTGPDILSSGNTEIFNYDVLGLEDGGDLITAVNRLQRDVIRRQVA